MEKEKIESRWKEGVKPLCALKSLFTSSSHFGERRARGARDLGAVVELGLGVDDTPVECGQLATHFAQVGLGSVGAIEVLK